MTVGQNIRTLRKARGMTQQELADAINVSGAAVSEWERDQNQPRAGAIQRMSDLFRIPMASLMTEDGLGSLAVRRKLVSVPSRTVAPLVGSISAGEPREGIEDMTELVTISEAQSERYPGAFFLRVRGDSMNRVAPEGALALVDPDSDVAHGDVVAATVNGEDTPSSACS